VSTSTATDHSVAGGTLANDLPRPSRLWWFFVAAFALQLSAWVAWFIIAAHHPVGEVPVTTGRKQSAPESAPRFATHH